MALCGKLPRQPWAVSKTSCNPEDGIIIWGFGTGRQDHVLAHGKAEGEGCIFFDLLAPARTPPAFLGPNDLELV